VLPVGPKQLDRNREQVGGGANCALVAVEMALAKQKKPTTALSKQLSGRMSALYEN
jgi:hypothetical protein